jgi:hypothetical protein
VNLKPYTTIWAGLILLAATPMWPQANDSAAQSTSAPSSQAQDSAAGIQDSQSQGAATSNNSANEMQGGQQNQQPNPNDDRMLTPPVVSGQSYPTIPGDQERSNYLRGGMTFTSAYTDNAADGKNGRPISEMSYSVAPSIALDETTSRLHSVLTYAPGFTAYQQTGYLNSADQNATIDLQYRLSPHVTLSGKDNLMKSSSIFNQPDLATAGAVSAGAQAANFSVIAPNADFLRNSGSTGITYQFSLNGMIGANGTFSNLHYPDPAQVSGLYDSSTQGGSAFYSHRVSKLNYIGATYQYQRLMSYPGAGVNETQTHAVMLFYTLYPSSHFSLSFFGGPQYSNTTQPPVGPLHFQPPAATAWTPAAGGSLSWQGRRNTFALSYSHVISGGGGLNGAVHMDNASASLSQQITRALTGTVNGAYVQNNVLGSFLPSSYNGHTVSGTVALQQQFHQRISVQLGYTRMRQDYTGVAVIAATPDTNREFVSLSYQFSRPMGR